MVSWPCGWLAPGWLWGWPRLFQSPVFSSESQPHGSKHGLAEGQEWALGPWLDGIAVLARSQRPQRMGLGGPTPPSARPAGDR